MNPRFAKRAIHSRICPVVCEVMLADLEADPARQTVVEDRLDSIQRLKTKYGGSVEAVLETGKRARQDLQTLEHHEAQMSERTKRDSRRRTSP